MDIVTVLGGILVTAGTAWLTNVQYKVRKLEQDLNNKMTKKEVRELIGDKLEVLDVQLKEVKDDVEKVSKLDLDSLTQKLDRIIETLNR